MGGGWPSPLQESSVNTTVKSDVDSDVKSLNDSKPEKKPLLVGIGDPLPSLTLTLANGTRQTLTRRSGHTLLINFWATWCAPCRQELPRLQRFADSPEGARVQVIGIAIDREAPVRRFLEEIGVNYENYVGGMEAARAAEQFAPDFALPLSVVVAPDGTVLAVHTGVIQAGDLVRMGAVAEGLAKGTLKVRDAPSRFLWEGT